MKILQNNVDIEQCVRQAGNKFDLILIASVRAREISRGSSSRTDGRHKNTVRALEEVQNGAAGRDLLRQVGRRRGK